jgi:hypothetical protein
MTRAITSEEKMVLKNPDILEDIVFWRCRLYANLFCLKYFKTQLYFGHQAYKVVRFLCKIIETLKKKNLL